MATMVGTQRELSKLLNALLELDLDAIEAYRAACERLKNESDKTQLSSFQADHERHVRELRPFIAQMNERPAIGPDAKVLLAKGKVVLAGLVGDRAILTAMKTNEDDTNTAYERACRRGDIPADLRVVLDRGLADERRHREYILQRLGRSAQPTAQPHR
jgi:uncharacterized protein (TIGR02284 family)